SGRPEQLNHTVHPGRCNGGSGPFAYVGIVKRRPNGVAGDRVTRVVSWTLSRARPGGPRPMRHLFRAAALGLAVGLTLAATAADPPPPILKAVTPPAGQVRIRVPITGDPTT